VGGGEARAVDGVLAADHHPVVRAGIAAMLANEPDIEVVADAANAAEAIALFERHRPDVVLMDLQMAAQMEARTPFAAYSMLANASSRPFRTSTLSSDHARYRGDSGT
jgi:DNA-binding NarL/FixJ family response regulator